MQGFSKALALTSLTFLIGTMFMSLLVVGGTVDAASFGMADCPFMVHEDTLCPMDIVDHLAAWKTAFQTTSITSIVSLIGAAAALIWTVLLPQRILPLLGVPVAVVFRSLREEISHFSCRQFQMLFSDGLLHPKPF